MGKKENLMEHIRSESETMHKKANDIAKRLKDGEAMNESKDSKIKEITKTVKRKSDEISDLKNDNIKKDMRINSVTEELDDMKDDLSNCEKSYDEVFKRNHSLETDLAK